MPLPLSSSYICTLDVGSTKIAAAVAEVKNRRINRIFFDTFVSQSISKGVIVDSVGLVNSISRLLKNLKVKSGINIKFIYANISGDDIFTKHSRAIIPLAERGNKVISRHDLLRVKEQARILGASLEEEILHQIPISYNLDSKANILNPLGLYSHRLEVDLYLVGAKLSATESLARMINQAGYELKGLFFSGLATSSAVLNKEAKSGVTVFCDIGGDITELLLFKSGTLGNIEILHLGGNDLTKELQEELKIPFDLAEDLKRSFAIAGEPNLIDENKEVLIKRDNLYKPIKQKLVSQVMAAKTKLLCRQIKEAVEKITPLGEIDNFIVTGRTVLLEGFLEALETTLEIPLKLGRIAEPEILALVNRDNQLSGQKYLTYLSSLGMIFQAQAYQRQDVLSHPQSNSNPIFKTISKVREIYQEYF